MVFKGPDDRSRDNSEIVKNLLFIMPALESSPVDIVEDNQGAIKTLNNRHLSKRMGHVNIKYYLIDDLSFYSA